MDLPNKQSGEPPKKDIKPVVQGVKATRPATQRLKDYLFAESPKALGAKIGRDIIVPRIKAGVEEALNHFIAGMMWGDGQQRPMSNMVKGTVLRGGGTNYQQISSGQQASGLQQARQANTARSSGNYRDVICESQERAEFLLANMYELLNQYRVVAVGDLYEAANITAAPSDNAYGWYNLDGARIVKVREGYQLQLPMPSLIN